MHLCAFFQRAGHQLYAGLGQIRWIYLSLMKISGMYGYMTGKNAAIELSERHTTFKNSLMITKKCISEHRKNKLYNIVSNLSKLEDWRHVGSF